MDQESSNTKKVLKGISSQTLVTLVLGVVEIVSFSIMSRLLTKEDFGYYAAITAVTSVFQAFSQTGIGSAIIQKKDVDKRFINNAFTLSFIFGFVISVALLFLSGPLSRMVADESMKTPLMLMSVTLLLNCLTSVNISIMHKRLQFLRIGLINLISLVVTTLVAIWLAIKGHGYYAIITKAILTSILTYFISLFLCKTKFGVALDKTTFKNIFSFSGWLMASTLFSNLAHQVDRLLMPRLLSITALGAYNRPKDFIEQISSKLNGIFDSALFPVLSELQNDKERLANTLRRSLYYLNIFAMLLSLAFVFNSRLIIKVFFGEEWLNLTGIMMVLACSLVFNIDGRLSDCYLRSLAMTKQQFYFRIFEMVLKTIGVLIGFKWNIIGVAVSVVITNSITKLIKICFIASKINFKVKEVLGTIICSWKFALVLIPICSLYIYFTPNELVWDIMMAVLFCVVVIIEFLVFPILVGQRYREETYENIKQTIIKKLHK